MQLKYDVIIVGSGPLKEELNNLIKFHSLENKVILLGRIEDSELGSYYEACDLYCLPSIVKSEAFGIVQIEAMSFGKPIVATKINGSGVDWVNKDDVSGINVEPKDPEALAEAFRRIFNNKDDYERYSINAKKRFNSLFKRKKMNDRLIQLYKELLS
jgi:glycosyltransferase involved in cell wall biosynthesis